VFNLHGIITKRLAKIVQQAFQENASVALLGPRQVGKTTLAIGLLQKDSGVYIDPEDSAERLKMDISELARSINVSVTTANRYLDLMVDLHWLD